MKPNLQNIPIESELGKEIRRSFVKDGYYLMVADYSALEMRIYAEITKGKNCQ